MSSGLLSLKWNNHKSTFFHVLSTIRSKESYCDVTLACDGRFYSLHKFVLSTCSEYFEEMFERTQCKHPVIVLKDINSEDLEALLNYMYVGEVNVVQEKLAGLIKAAECLKIKGLAVPDEDPMESKDNSSIDRERHKRSQRGEDSPRAKRRRRENSSDVSEEILSPVRSRPSARSREHHGSQSAKSAAAAVAPSEENEDGSRETHALTDASEEAENSSINANRRTDGPNKTKLSSQVKSKREPEQVNLEEEDEQDVKTELHEEEEEDVVGEDGGEGLEELDSKASLHEQLGLEVHDATDDGFSSAGVMEGHLDGPSGAGASGYHENSFLWEGDGSLSAFPGDGFSGDSSQSRQTVRTDACAAFAASAPRTYSASGDSLLEGAKHSRPACPAGSSITNTHIAKAKDLPNSSVTTSTQPHHDVTSFSSSVDSEGSSTIRTSLLPGATKMGGRSVKLDLQDWSSLVERSPSGGGRCVVCGLHFPAQSHLERHALTHTSLRPFSCPFCPHSSARKDNLKTHVWTKHQKQC